MGHRRSPVSPMHRKMSEETAVLIESTRNLINAGFSFQIVNGEPEFEQDSEQCLVAELEKDG